MNAKLSPQALEELLGQSVDMLTVLDGSGIIQFQNPAVKRIVGYAPEELVGDSAFDYIHPDAAGRRWTPSMKWLTRKKVILQKR